ncbi:hypothetical protein K2173_022549 [Erythroxylum novogranatense]|uniref:F-box domain-containing protein n=1 Tax=Erythroxylum novogranatense TaxID=1862640 RepID=A0AAV8TJN3_9ROSI|nr:hypothetical protein K2173_022549 [Erythroxylum novogranatense]
MPNKSPQARSRSPDANPPRELVVDILSRLPVKSLCKFRCVSKSWLSMISSTHFAKIHLGFARRNKAVECSRQRLIMSCQNLYSAEYGSIGSCRDDIREIQAVKLDYAWKSYWIDVVGSCNGLLCIAPNENTLFLFNPSTRESKRIEKALMFELGVDAHLCCHGFGYDSTGDDYKVVRIGSGSVVSVYSLRTDSWRRIGNFPYNNSSVYESGLLLNGSVHWAVYSKEGEKPKNLVVAFDLEKEVFRDILAPDTVDPSSRIAIGVFGEKLCVLHSRYDIHNKFWIMKEYGVVESWTKIAISLPYFCMKPLCLTQRREALILMDGRLLLYDFGIDEYKFLELHGVPAGVAYETDIYVESLISPNHYFQTERKT